MIRFFRRLCEAWAYWRLPMDPKGRVDWLLAWEIAGISWGKRAREIERDVAEVVAKTRGDFKGLRGGM